MLTKYNVLIGILLALLPLAFAGGGEPVNGPQWTLVHQATPKELADGASLLFQGASPVPFYAPRPEHFRLKRLGPKAVWEVMTFGWPEPGRVEFDHPKDATTGEVNLHLRRSDGGKQRLQIMMLQTLDRRDPSPVDLYAESALQEGVRYRLSWSFRLAESDTVQTKHCEFQIGEALARARSTGSGAKEPSERPYLVEILFRDDDGVLFLAQTVLPEPEAHDFTVAAVGFTSDGKHVRPPDPGYVTKQVNLAYVVAKSATPKPWPAERTHLFGASIKRAYAPPSEVAVSISDMGTTGPLPKTSGEPTFIAFSSGLYDAVFRVDLLSANVEILRQDLDHWRKRTREITAELLEQRSWIKKDTRRHATVTRVLRTPLGDSQKSHPLSRAMDAADRGDVATLKAMLDNDPQLAQATDQFGNGLLHAAARAGRKVAVELLVDKGANVNGRNDRGETALLLVVQYSGNLGLARSLIARGASATIAAHGEGPPVGPWDERRGKDKGWTPLHFAANRGSAELVRLLLAHGAVVNASDLQDYTPLHLAARGGQKDAADLLIAAGADIKSRTVSGCTPLHYAACGGSTDLVKWLLAEGAPVNAREHNGMTPLHWAARCGHAESVSLLLTSGADIDAAGEVGRTALHEAAINSKTSVLELLLKKKALVNTKDDGGMTPLHWAADRGKPEVVRSLLDAGGDVSAKDNVGRTPVSIATESGHDEALRLLKAQATNDDIPPK